MDLQLYKVAPEFAALVEADDLTDEDMARLDELGHAIEVKADNICAVVDRLASFAEYAKAEADRISAKAKAAEGRAAWLKNYLQRNMEAANIDKIEVGTRKIVLQKNPPAVVVDHEDDIPARFFTTIPEQHKLDKKAVGAALKAGENVKGCHLVQGVSLRIK